MTEGPVWTPLECNAGQCNTHRFFKLNVNAASMLYWLVFPSKVFIYV